MPHIDESFKYIPLPQYPHMGPEDAQIWNDFISTKPDLFSTCWYDMRVGEGGDVSKEEDRTFEKQWWDLTRWRADVIAEDGLAIYVIELKPRANAKALGQANAYAALFIDNHHPKIPVYPVVISDTVVPSTIAAAKAMGVGLWLSNGEVLVPVNSDWQIPDQKEN